MKQGRGMLTDRVKAASMKAFGYEIDQIELRLMPYFHFIMLNEQRVERDKLNSFERMVLDKWNDAGYISGGTSRALLDGHVSDLVTCTPEFWAGINEMLYLAYVDAGK